MKSRSSKNSATQNSSGFTLVELQVALLLMSMIAILLTGALRANVQAWAKSTQHQDTSEHRYMVGQFLRRHMESMRFQRVRDQELKIRMSFVGNRRSIHYIAPHPGVGHMGDLFIWSLENHWNEDTGKDQLALTFVPYTSIDSIEFEKNGGMRIPDSEPTQIVVSENFLIKEFRYYTEGSQGIENWHNELEAGSEAPKIIEVTLIEVGKSANPPKTTELAISPRLYTQELASTGGT